MALCSAEGSEFLTGPKLYSSLAKYYDAIHGDYEYMKRADAIERQIRKMKPDSKEILEVACGTCSYAAILSKKGYKITGTDKSRKMLAQARKKCPKIELLRADMKTFKINKKFDVILCLFNSILYNKNTAELTRTLKNFKKHLKPRGIIAFDFVDNKFVKPLDFTTKLSRRGVFIDRKGAWIHGKQRNRIYIEDFIIIEDHGKYSAYFDSHEMGAFSKKEIKRILTKLNLDAKLMKWHFTVNPTEEDLHSSIVFAQLRK
jgi:ubiquinone/menaquinone biosynthesis C-methylase UbiE